MAEKIKGLRTVAHETRNIPDGFHLQVMYDPEKNKVFAGDLLTTSSYERYDNQNLIFVCDAYMDMTMREIEFHVNLKKDIAAGLFQKLEE